MLNQNLLIQRTLSQRVHPDAAAVSVEEAVASLVGLQAQEPRSVALGVRARTTALNISDVMEALYEKRTVVRTWCMRGTLHLVARADVRWLLAVFGPVFVRRSRRRLETLGLADADSDRAMDVMRDALSRRHAMTRAELATAVRDARIPVDLDGQAPYHLVRRAALLGILCEYDDEEGDPRYGLLDDLVPEHPTPDRDAALRRLARRYVVGYGPVSIDDFASWSRLPMRDIRPAWAPLEKDADVVSADDRRLLSLPEGDSRVEPPEPAHVLRLLPAYDAYVLGYESIVHALPEADAGHIQPGGGVVRPIVVVDGRIVGTWKIGAATDTVRVSIRLFDQVPRADEERLRSECETVSRFLGRELAVFEVGSGS